MASVYRRGTAFYAKVKDSAGRWHNVRTSATKRGQALAAAEELQQQLDRGQPLPSGRAVTLTVAALCDRFLAEYTRPRIKDLARYRALAGRHLRTLVLPHLGELPVQQLRRAQVERMVAALREAGKAERTVQAALARLSTVFSWAQAQEILDVARNPCASIERGRLPKVVDHLALQEVQALLNHQQRLRPAQALVWTMAVGHARQGGAATLAYLGGEEGEGAESLAFLAAQLARLTYKG